MAGTVPFYATQGTVYVGDAYKGTVCNASLLPSHIPGTADTPTADVKEISITGGDRDLASIKLMGTDEAQDVKRVGVVTIQFTIVGKDHDWMEYVMGTAAAGQKAAGSYKMVTGAELVTGSSTGPQEHSVIFKFTDGTNTAFCGTFRGIPSNIDTSISADGQSMEQTITFRCLATHYHWQDNFS